MTLDEAIKHAKQVANSECSKCAEEHKQLAEWLKELKKYRQLGSIKEIKEMDDTLNAYLW